MRDVGLGHGREVRHPHAKAVGKALRRLVAGLAVVGVGAKAAFDEHFHVRVLIKRARQVLARGVGHQRHVRQHEQPVAGPVHLGRHRVGLDAPQPERAGDAAQVGHEALVLLIELEDLMRVRVVHDRHVRAQRFQREVRAEALDLLDGAGDGAKAGRRLAVQGHHVVAGRFEAEVLGPVLPEHGAGRAADQRHPEQHGLLARVRLLVPGDAAARHAGVDLLVPPAAVAPHVTRPVEAEGPVGDEVGIVLRQKMVGRHRHAPAIHQGGAVFVLRLRPPAAVGAFLVHRIDGIGQVHHPLQVVGDVLVMEAPVPAHLDDVAVGPRRLDVLPAAEAAVERDIEFVQGELRSQPRLVSRQRVRAIAGEAAALARPGR